MINKKIRFKSFHSLHFIHPLFGLFFQDFQGILSDLQDWELSFKDKDKKIKAHASDKELSVIQLHPLAFCSYFSTQFVKFLSVLGNLCFFSGLCVWFLVKVLNFLAFEM